MKRAENCVNAQITPIYFDLFEFAKSKRQQDGEENLEPWHIDANPNKPWV